MKNITMRFAMEAAKKQGLIYASPHVYRERLHDAAMDIQRAAEPLLAIVREACLQVAGSGTGAPYCGMCKHKFGAHHPTCLVPAAMKSMEVCDG